MTPIASLTIQQAIDLIKEGHIFADGKGNRFWTINESFVLRSTNKGKPVRDSHIMLWESYVNYLIKNNFYFENLNTK
jgi:hypothetical protein